jgi:hypothetical protein
VPDDGADAGRVVSSMSMNAVKARVQNGRILVDEPTDLPDGVVYLVPVDETDDLDDEERAALNQALDEALDDADAGRVVDEEELRAVVRAAR